MWTRAQTRARGCEYCSCRCRRAFVQEHHRAQGHRLSHADSAASTRTRVQESLARTVPNLETDDFRDQVETSVAEMDLRGWQSKII